MRPETADHKRKPEVTDKPGLKSITDNGSTISCSCGWVKTHSRLKIREDAAETHANKKHGGFVIWT